MDFKSDKDFINASVLPLIDLRQPKPKRKSNMVALARLFSVLVIVGFAVGLYWRLA